MQTKTTKSRLLSLIFTATLLLWLALTSTAHAVTNSIYLTPSSQKASKGSTFTIAVNVNTSSNVTAIGAYLSYPSSQMSFQDVSYSGTAFDTKTEWAGGGGSIRIGRSTAATVTGDLPVAVLTFKVTAESGTGTISVLNTSTLENAGTPVVVQYGSATVDFGAAAPDTQQKPTTTYTKLASPADAANYDLKPPVMSAVKSEQKEANSQIITWTTDEPSTSKVEYGMDASYGLTTMDATMVKAHKLTLHSPFLVPNTVFHYKVTSVDGNGNTVYSTDFTFRTVGIMYSVTVLGSDGKPLPHAAVTLNAHTVYTDANGKASLMSGPGKQALTIKFRDVSLSKTVTIDGDKTEQLGAYKLAAQNTLIDGRYIIYPILVAIGVFLGLATRAYLVKAPLTFLRKGKVRLMTMTISNVQEQYGDKNPAHNPYQRRRLFGFWAVWDFLVGMFSRPSKYVTKKVREEVKAAGDMFKASPPNKK